jgi:CheY-like chemotaxis protein
MAGPKKVLIVDDDEGVRLFVDAIMAGEGWHCVEGRTGQDALDLADSEKPDLIILDVNMPLMDGFEAFRKLRDSPFTQDIPIIMLTAINIEGDGEQFDEHKMEQKFGVVGPEGFVEKPVDANFLLQSVMGVMG